MKNPSAADIQRVFELQRKNKWTTKVSTVEERKAHLERLRDAIAARGLEIGEALTADLRRPIEGRLPMEAMTVLGDIEFALAHLAEWMQPAEVEVAARFGDASGTIYSEARGVVLIFGAWNFPFALALQPLIPAIAAGNTVILKPNELAPAVSAVVAAIIEEVFEQNFVAVFEGGVELAEQLLELPVDHIFFTGSPAVAKRVMAAAAQHLSSVTLELGGKCPVIIDGTTDLSAAVNSIARGKHYNAGQICLAPDHVWIKRELRDEFVEKYLAWIDQNLVTDGELDTSKLSRIVDERNYRRVVGYVDDALERGATLRGTRGGDETTLTVNPVLLIDVPSDADVMQEEIFGPVLPVMTFEDIDEVIAVMQQSDKPLAIYGFSSDAELMSKVLSATSSGGATINGWASHISEPGLPFGGVNNSGMGSYHGVHGFRELSHQRSVLTHKV